MSQPNPEDEELLARLRDLSLVDIDTLLAGTSGEQYAELLTAYGEDLQDALRCARQRMSELLREVSGGPDPMAIAEMTPAVRARDGGREVAQRVAGRLEGRAAACRALARLDDLTAQLLPRLLEADRRRASLGTARG
jgi:uncharacterized protein (DUF433 family)